MNRLLKIVGILLAIGATLTMLSCSGSTPDSAISEQPIANPSVSILIRAYPVVSTVNGKTDYKVSAAFIDHRNGAQPNSFITAEVSANGVSLLPIPTANNIFITTSLLQLGEGDTVSVMLKHPDVGTINRSATVPPGVSAFSLNPLLPSKGVAFGQTSCTMNWLDNGSDAYIAKIFAYDITNNFVQGYMYNSNSSTYTFPFTSLTVNSTPIPYFDFSLAAVNRAMIDGFGFNSALNVESAYQPLLSNRPSGL